MRIKFNTTWEEDAEERRKFYAGLTYSERLRYFFTARKKINFHKEPVKRFDLVICDAKRQKAPYLELYIPGRSFSSYYFYNALTIKTIEDARNGIGLGEPIKNIKEYMESL